MGDVTNLNDHRPPFTYTVDLSHYPDGRFQVQVRDVVDSIACRLSVAQDLRHAAEMLENSTKDSVM